MIVVVWCGGEGMKLMVNSVMVLVVVINTVTINSGDDYYVIDDKQKHIFFISNSL